MAGLVAVLALMLTATGAPVTHRATLARTAPVRPARVAITTTTTVSAADAKLLGQRIMVGLNGTSADSALLTQVRRGQLGAVILFAANIVSRSQLEGLIGALQQAARQGGNPPLLIAVDQEGGAVKRLPGGPPDLSPPQIAATGSTTVATREGRATGHYLKGLGINMDLAPVSDVPTFQGAFIWLQGRAFSFSPRAVARYAPAFALGLQSQRVAATAKHFPGVGSAGVDTDFKLDELHPTAAQLRGALMPYQAAIPLGSTPSCSPPRASRPTTPPARPLRSRARSRRDCSAAGSDSAA